MAKDARSINKSKLEDHKLFKKELIAPLNSIGNMSQIFWWRDQIPEFLWISGLVNEFGERAAPSLFERFLGKIDGTYDDKTGIVDGTMSSFQLVPEASREQFVTTQRGLIEQAVYRCGGYLPVLYPQNPMAWLFTAESASQYLPDRDTSVEVARAAVLRLFDGKDSHASFCRCMAMSRYFAHQKVHLAEHMKDIADALLAYPKGDRARTESFCRSMMNMSIQHRAAEKPEMLEWARMFWNANEGAAPCVY